MEEERIYQLMIKALDGESDAAESAELQTRLDESPALAHEYAMMARIDTLLRTTPAVAPPRNLVARTLAQLPQAQHNLWFIGVFYMVLLFSGLLPIGLGVWAYFQFGDLAVLDTFLQTGSSVWGVTQTLAGALITSIGNLIADQPLIFGWLTILLGIVLTWRSVYVQLTRRPQVALARASQQK
jgi:hypothetical protein